VRSVRCKLVDEAVLIDARVPYLLQCGALCTNARLPQNADGYRGALVYFSLPSRYA